MQKILRASPKYLALENPLGKSVCDYLLINTSGKCGYSCKKCCNASPNLDVKLREEEVGQILKRAKEELGIRALGIFGEGEPLESGLTMPAVECAHGLGLETVMFTNGYFLDRKTAEQLRRNGVSVVLSIDFLQEDAYDGFVGKKGAFKRVMENFRQCRTVFDGAVEERGDARIYRLAVNMVVNLSNMDRIGEFKRFCGEDVMFICNYPIPQGYANKWRNEIYGRNKEWAELKELALRESDNEGFSGVTSEERCGYLFNGLAIGIDGSVLLCPYGLETRGMFGKVGGDTDLAMLNRGVKEALGRLPHKEVWKRCLLRAPEQYAEFKRLAARE